MFRSFTLLAEVMVVCTGWVCTSPGLTSFGAAVSLGTDPSDASKALATLIAFPIKAWVELLLVVVVNGTVVAEVKVPIRLGAIFTAASLSMTAVGSAWLVADAWVATKRPLDRLVHRKRQ